MSAYKVTDRRAQNRREVRDPSAATINTAVTSPGNGQVSEWDAEQAIKIGFYGNVFTYRCVQVIAQAVAALPFRAGSDPDTPGKYDPKAPLARLLGPMPGSPNPEMTARTLWANAVANYLVTGAFAWEFDYGTAKTSTPVGLWPLPVAKVHPVSTTGGAAYFSGYQFTPATGGKKTLKAENVLYAWRPSLHDVRQPESALKAAGLNISVAMMLDQYNVAFLRNNAMPAAAVVTAAFERSEDKEAFQRQFAGRHQGPGNAGRVAFLEADAEGEGGVSGMLDIKTLGLSQRDAQAIQQYQAQIQAICVGLGVPLSLLGDASGRTFDNAGQEVENFWTGTMLPLLAEIQDHINLRLAPRLGTEVGWFDLSKVKALQPSRNITAVPITDLVAANLASNEEAREFAGLVGPAPAAPAVQDAVNSPFSSVGLPALIEAGVITEDDARTMLGLPGAAPGKPALPAPADPAAVDPTSGTASAPEGQVRHAGPDHTHTVGGHGPAATISEAIEVQARKIGLIRDAHLTILTRSMTHQAQYLLTRQAKSVAARLEGKRGRTLIEKRDADAAGIYDPTFWVEEVRQWAEAMCESAVALAASTVDGFDPDAPQISTFVATRSKALAKALTEEIHTSVVRAAHTEGEHEAAIEAINAVMADFASVRAIEVAQSEAVLSYDQALDAVGGIDADTVADLLTKVAAGQIDANQALVALNTTGASA